MFHNDKWYEFACKLDHYENKLIIFCENCEKIFFIRRTTWRKLGGGSILNLSHLTYHATCCQKPDWLFITHFFCPQKEFKNEVSKNFITSLDIKGKKKYFWTDII